MPEKTAVDFMSFGGVDSRSSPLNFPPERSLRCLNWVPNAAGWLDLRSGYVRKTAVPDPQVPIHSIAPFFLVEEDGTITRYLLVGEGVGLFTMKMSDNTWTHVTDLPTNAPWQSFIADGQIHIGNKDGVWFYDGEVLRKSGIRSLTSDEVDDIQVSTVSQSITPAEAAAVTITLGSGGSWTNDSVGRKIYALVYDVAGQAISPAQVVANGQVTKGSTGQKITLGTVPVLPAGKVMVWGLGFDGNINSYAICTKGTSIAGTSVLSSGTVTVTSTSHGLTSGDVVFVHRSTSLFLFDIGPIAVTVVDANNFTFPSSDSFWNGATVTTYPALTGNVISDPTDVLGNYTVGVGLVGIPPSTVTSATPGYQLYLCIYNPVTQHCGNRASIGDRIVPAGLTTIRIDNLPVLEDAEWKFLVGYTFDGGETPYALIDSGGNYLLFDSGSTNRIVDGSYVQDQTQELPNRNGVPVAMTMFCVIGDNVVGCTGIDPYVRVSGSMSNPLNPEVLGRPPQSWAPNDVATFPNRELPSALFEYNGYAVVASRNNMAPFVNNNGIWDFGQAFPVGIAGKRAWAKTTHGPFWVSGHKQLFTANWGGVDIGPLPISDEYETALLSKIGDQYLESVEVVPVIDIEHRIDILIIKALDKDGHPFEVIHDFNLRDSRNPFGQGYLRQYQDVLSNPFTLALGYDANGVPKAYAGAADGAMYQTDVWGAADNGVEFDAEWIGIYAMGPDRPSLSDIIIWGDRKILDTPPLSYCRQLDGQGDWASLDPMQDRGDGDHDFKFHNRGVSGESDFVLLRIKMTSHSADAPQSYLSDPPHLPLEDYGRIYMSRSTFGTSRGI